MAGSIITSRPPGASTRKLNRVHMCPDMRTPLYLPAILAKRECRVRGYRQVIKTRYRTTAKRSFLARFLQEGRMWDFVCAITTPSSTAAPARSRPGKCTANLGGRARHPLGSLHQPGFRQIGLIGQLNSIVQ